MSWVSAGGAPEPSLDDSTESPLVPTSVLLALFMGKFLLLFEGAVFLGALGIPGSLQHKVEFEIRQAQASRIWQKILRQESLVETHTSCSPQNCLGTGMLHQLWIPS